MQKLNQLFFILLAFLVAGCSNDANLKKRAYELAHTYICLLYTSPSPRDS